MQNLTLDHNCLISLDEHDGQHLALQQLLALHDAGEVCVHVSVVSAQENLPTGEGEPSFGAFTERIERLGLSHLPQITPEWRLGVSYLGQCVLAGDDGLVDKVRAVIHQSTTVDGYVEFMKDQGLDPSGPVDPRWRNRFCDIDALVAHIRRGHDVFVTQERRMLSKREKLIAVGANSVLSPEEALLLVRSRRRADSTGIPC